MNKESIKLFMPLMQAMLEGKTIQFYHDSDKRWVDVDEISMYYGVLSYRIKPESKTRPFVNTDECWTEMEKHQPFGWVSRIDCDERCLITDVDGLEGNGGVNIDGEGCRWDKAYNKYTFVDGTPFGVKIEN